MSPVISNGSNDVGEDEELARLRQGSDFSEILDTADYIDADVLDDLDGEEIRAIAGRSISSSSSGESLIMHLVNAHKPKKEDSGSETFSIRISNKDVNVITEDGQAIPDVDLEIEIPKEKLKKNNTFRRRVWSLVNRLTRQSKEHQEVMIIKDKVQVKDENGKIYDLDLDLKVEMNNAQSEEIRKEMKKSKKSEQSKAKKEKEGLEVEKETKDSKPVQASRGLSKKRRSNSLRRLMCPINAPWSRSRRNIAWYNSSDEETDSLTSSEGGRSSSLKRTDLIKSTTLPSMASKPEPVSNNGILHRHPFVNSSNSNRGQKIRSCADLLSHVENNNDKVALMMNSLDPSGNDVDDSRSHHGERHGPFSLQDPVLIRRSTADLFRFTTV